MSLLNPDVKGTRIAILLEDLAHKNQHIKTLRAKLPTDRRGSQTLERAVSDAHAILLEAFKTGQTGRDFMLKATGMKRSAWQWAVAFLRLANIVKRNESGKLENWQAGLQFVIFDRDTAFAQHKKIALELEARTDAYTLLRRMRVYGYLPTEVGKPGYVHGQAKGQLEGNHRGNHRAIEANPRGNVIGNLQGNLGATHRAIIRLRIALEPRNNRKVIETREGMV